MITATKGGSDLPSPLPDAVLLRTVEASSRNGNKHMKSQAFPVAFLKSASVRIESLECQKIDAKPTSTAFLSNIKLKEDMVP